jgi:hypothetical protein
MIIAQAYPMWVSVTHEGGQVSVEAVIAWDTDVPSGDPFVPVTARYGAMHGSGGREPGGYMVTVEERDSFVRDWAQAQAESEAGRARARQYVADREGRGKSGRASF